MKLMKGDDADLNNLSFPYMLTPKLDGMRCIVFNGAALTSSMKPIPNKWIQECIGRPEYNGLDGELIVGEPTATDVFKQSVSGCRRVEGKPDFTFHVFDLHDVAEPAIMRYAALREHVAGLQHVSVIGASQCNSREELDAALTLRLDEGYEGVMLRSPGSPYKSGRSTVRENYLLKVKPFEDAEAVVIGMTEACTNTNPKKVNELGRSQRSSAQAGKVAKGTMGTLVMRAVNGRYAGVEFEIGTGFTEKQRAEAWAAGAALAGSYVTFKYQTVGNYEKPRLPVFKAYRPADEVEVLS